MGPLWYIKDTYMYVNLLHPHIPTINKLHFQNLLGMRIALEHGYSETSVKMQVRLNLTFHCDSNHLACQTYIITLRS